MEIASGEYNVDVNKIVKIALKKYYEDTGRRIAEEHSFEEGESLQLLLFFAPPLPLSSTNDRLIGWLIWIRA